MKKIYNKPEIYVKALALETVMYTTTIYNGGPATDTDKDEAKRYNYIVDDDEYDDF